MHHKWLNTFLWIYNRLLQIWEDRGHIACKSVAFWHPFADSRITLSEQKKSWIPLPHLINTPKKIQAQSEVSDVELADNSGTISQGSLKKSHVLGLYAEVGVAGENRTDDESIRHLRQLNFVSVNYKHSHVFCIRIVFGTFRARFVSFFLFCCLDNNFAPRHGTRNWPNAYRWLRSIWPNGVGVLVGSWIHGELVGRVLCGGEPDWTRCSRQNNQTLWIVTPRGCDWNLLRVFRLGWFGFLGKNIAFVDVYWILAETISIFSIFVLPQTNA